MRLLKIGRDQTCDIVLHSQKTSALHAEMILLNNGDILLEDKESTNGTYVMNQRIKSGVLVNVKRGDAIRFADVELIWDQVPKAEDNSSYKAIYGIGSHGMNEIQAAGKTVSRFHATLKIDKKGRATLLDHSMNGTLLNGKRIPKGMAVPVKKHDSVVCGGVPVDLDPYLPSVFPWMKAAIVAACVALLVGCGYGIWWWTMQQTLDPKNRVAMENASACVYGGFYYVVTIKDDPFKGQVPGWPTEWMFGHDGQGNLVNENFHVYCSDMHSYSGVANPFEYNGTAFFISENGELGTNRHVAIPWEYTKKSHEDKIRNFIVLMCHTFAQDLANSVHSTRFESVGKMIRLTNVDLEITGRFSYLGIGLTGTKINSLVDLQQCQVIAESGDPKKDVALMRLNSRKTPDYLVKMRAIYDIENARVNERSLKMQEDLTIIGYPGESFIGKESFDGKELRPTVHGATLSKTPDDNQIQIQTVGIGGQSGSPVIDKKHRLVGVLCSGFDGMEVTYCCNIKHLKELYDKNKVRE